MALLSMVCGVTKAIRDNKTQTILTGLQTNALSAENELKDTVSAYKNEITTALNQQIKQDTTKFDAYINLKFANLQRALNNKGLGLDANWKLVPSHDNALQGSDIYIGNGVKFGRFEMNGNKFYNSPKPTNDTSKLK